MSDNQQGQQPQFHQAPAQQQQSYQQPQQQPQQEQPRPPVQIHANPQALTDFNNVAGQLIQNLQALPEQITRSFREANPPASPPATPPATSSPSAPAPQQPSTPASPTPGTPASGNAPTRESFRTRMQRAWFGIPR